MEGGGPTEEYAWMVTLGEMTQTDDPPVLIAVGMPIVGSEEEEEASKAKVRYYIF